MREGVERRKSRGASARYPNCEKQETAAPVDARALQDHKSATHAAGAVVARPARPTCEIDRSNAELNLPRTFDSSSL